MRTTNFVSQKRRLLDNSSVATLAGLIVATAWLGCACPASAAALKVSPTTDHPAATVQVKGSKFGAGEAVDVYFDTTDELLVATNRTGAFGWHNLPVPSNALPGTHWVTAIGRTSGTSVQRPFTVSTDWPQFRFSELQEGANPYENVLSPANVSGLNTDWSAAADPYYSFSTASPIVANGVVFAGGRGQGGDGQEIDALNATTGAELWSAATAGQVIPSPAVANGIVYVSSIDGTIQAFSAATGASVWAVTMPSTAFPPAVANGVLYAGCLDNNLYAFDAATGAALWTATTGGEDFSSPAVANGVVYVSSEDGKLYAFNAATGAALWTVTVGGLPSSAAVASGAVYVSSDSGAVHALNATTGAVLWTVITGSRVYATPAVANGVVYVGSYDDKLYAIDATTGTVLWTALTGAPTAASAAVANSVVYVGSDDDKLYAFDAASGKALWTGVTGAFVSSPAVANGMAYAVSSDGINAILNAYALNGGKAAVYRTSRPAPIPSMLQPDWRLKPAR